ncbi:hypothetical protein Pmar_PMAR003115 [Perkinsus marinus ATCC 50983]|uniref:Uncharacterized protein n=1 Tax=Perkinsus marinus (strain ATCC 50983 / TXsc) TaxID=423536 RepID=C5L2Y0_PERM5|nr:hypothetical protein Pmar_PMAR003115 [Perkinsus marinus ATCC 50983]EER08867.1 hypothetical protein Pmar_PMAR003115 [Perkinsus marinus ATCC 50983]|eukprot:XP_002777051.1 hypothetical protein Pmar_PMAR003115 [Perkinsus marinus ATCC 50983]
MKWRKWLDKHTQVGPYEKILLERGVARDISQCSTNAGDADGESCSICLVEFEEDICTMKTVLLNAFLDCLEVSTINAQCVVLELVQRFVAI